jgi:hypothetical protein
MGAKRARPAVQAARVCTSVSTSAQREGNEIEDLELDADLQNAPS